MNRPDMTQPADYDAPEKGLGGDVTDAPITDYPHTPPVARPCGRDDCREGHAYVLDGDWYRCVIPPAKGDPR